MTKAHQPAMWAGYSGLGYGASRGLVQGAGDEGPQSLCLWGLQKTDPSA